jgi:hypothetical protein
MLSDMCSLKAKVFCFDMIRGTYGLKFDICLFWYISTSDMRESMLSDVFTLFFSQNSRG